MVEHKSEPKVLVITGASSGIGQALAEHYAKAGVTLGLTGRNRERLDEVGKACMTKGAHVVTAVLDVVDQDEMRKWLHDFDNEYSVDIVIANAGISAGTGGVLTGEEPTQVRHVFDVNLNGVLNTIEPLQDRMISRGKGKLVIMSSLAGYRGWPGAPAYCGSKAAVRVYGESLRGALKKTGVQVSVVCPGFVKSRMTDQNAFPMPLLVQADKAAVIIARGLRKNKGRIAFPLLPSIMAWLVMALPDLIAQTLLRNTPAKKASDK